MPEHLKKYVNCRISLPYFTDYDKTYIKNTIIEIKRDINKAFGKGTVR